MIFVFSKLNYSQQAVTKFPVVFLYEYREVFEVAPLPEDVMKCVVY